ncbi:MAG: homoserine kinase [Candidatus Omnitrophica bacterium]|nr:homoserine kinase [Candidatus Omnitrophota bacterium]
MSFQPFRVRVPATTANLGAGFDCLGLALSLHNELEVSPSGLTKLGIEGEGAGQLPTDDANLVLKTIRKVSALIGRELPEIRVLCRNRIPLARGMGSSAAVLVSSAVAANRLHGNPLSQSQILHLVVEEEGHADNVAPAMYGGLAVCGQRGAEPVFHRIDPVRDLKVVLLIPDFHLETSKAREAMPSDVSLADAVANLQNCALTAVAFSSGDYTLLESSLNDRLHQPYRKGFIPGFDEVLEAATSAGAYGAALSGAGPTMAAFTVHHAEKVAKAMENGYSKHGKGACRTMILEIDTDGAVVADLD